MRHFLNRFRLAVILASLAATPALAQLSPTGGGSGPAQPQPRGPAPDIAPPALPGAGDTPDLATGPKLQKPVSGDPTTALFAAVNAGNYNDAQDAVSRGADIDAQNALGETPLDLSIALNRNNITFMLLSARNEGGDTTAITAPTQAAAIAQPARQVYQPKPTRAQTTAPGNIPGTPNAAAGFLGFGKSE